PFPPPGARGGARGGDQDPRGARVELTELLDQPLGGTEQFAIHIDLALVPRAVADPHGPAIPPAGQVRQLTLGKVVFAADPEHDLQVHPAPQLRGRRVSQERRRTCWPRRGRPPPTAPPWSGRSRAPRCSGSPSCARRRWFP